MATEDQNKMLRERDSDTGESETELDQLIGFALRAWRHATYDSAPRGRGRQFVDS